MYMKGLVVEVIEAAKARAAMFDTKDMRGELRWVEERDKSQLKRMAVEARQIEKEHMKLERLERIEDLRRQTSSRWEVPMELCQTNWGWSHW